MKFITILLQIAFLFQLSCSTTKEIHRKLAFLDQFPEKSFRIKRLSGSTLIEFSKSNYIIQHKINIPSNIILNGNGSIFYNNITEDANVINLDNAENVTIKNSVFTTNKHISSRPRFFISVKNSSHLLFDSITFLDIKETAIHLTDVNNGKIRHCSFNNLQLYKGNIDRALSIDGIFIGGYKSSNKIDIINCNFERIGNQVDFKKRKNDGDGIHIQGASNSIINQIHIRECNFKLCSSRAVKMQSGMDIEIKDNNVDSCNLGFSFALAHNVNKITIENNKISNCKNAISSYSSNLYLKTSGISIKKNKIDNTQYFIRNGLEMHNFTIKDNKATNIGRCFLSGMFQNGSIINNTISIYATEKNKSFDMAIHLTKKSSNVKIFRNIFTSNSKLNRGILLDKNTNSIIINENIFNLPPKMTIHLDTNNKSHKVLKNRSIRHR